MVDINIPEVVAEVTAAFERYEKSLGANDVEVLDATFWNDPRVIRYSITDNAYGFEAIHASRLARPKTDMRRTISNTVITTFGRDLATANTEFERIESGRRGRQSQTRLACPRAGGSSALMSRSCLCRRQRQRSNLLTIEAGLLTSWAPDSPRRHSSC